MSSVLRACRLALAPARARTASASAKAKSKREGAITGIQKPFPLSPTLASFLGVSESSRANTMKVIWDHIKLHNLQNPANRREIICDTKLKSLFDGRDKVTMFEIAKFISPHFLKNE